MPHNRDQRSTLTQLCVSLNCLWEFETAQCRVLISEFWSFYQAWSLTCCSMQWGRACTRLLSQMAFFSVNCIWTAWQQRVTLWQRQSTQKLQNPIKSDRIRSLIRIRMTTCPVWTPESDSDQSGGLKWSTAGISWCPRLTATQSGGEAQLFIIIMIIMTLLLNRTARPTVSVHWDPDDWASTQLSRACLNVWHWHTGKTNLSFNSNLPYCNACFTIHSWSTNSSHVNVYITIKQINWTCTSLQCLHNCKTATVTDIFGEIHRMAVFLLIQNIQTTVKCQFNLHFYLINRTVDLPHCNVYISV